MTPPIPLAVENAAPEAATLATLPEELTIQILKYLSAKEIAVFGAASRDLHVLCDDDVVWARLAFLDYGVSPSLFGHATPVVRNQRNRVQSMEDAICPIPPKLYYAMILAPFGKFLGYFQSDFPFFTARFLSCRIDYAAGGVIVGEELEAINILPRAEMTSVFSLDNTLSIDHLEPRIVKTRAFQVDLAGQAKCCGHALGAPSQPGRHRAVVAERGNLSRTHVDANQQHPCTLKERGGGFLALPEEEIGGQLWSEFDLFPFARPMLFPIPTRSVPNATTGLWPFLQTQTHVRSTQTSRLSDMLVMSCSSTCAIAKLTIVTFDEDSKFTTNYTPRFSRIKFDLTVPPPSVVRNPVKPGVWVGTYGGHGLECLLIRYVAIPDGWQMHAFKITGDVNVPRGERSIRVFLNEPVPGGVITLGHTDVPHDINLNSAPELQPRWVRQDEHSKRVDLQVFAAQGTVAHVGFRSSTEIPAWVVMNGDTEEFVVVWDQLGKLSRFRFAGIE